MAENQTKMFWKYLNARIAIYGISVQTKIFIEENSDLNIVGFLDSYKKEGIIYGKPILDLDELLKRDIDVIIIIARVNSTEMIFRKISDFCLKNHIQVLNSKGKEIKHEDYKDQFEEVNNISLEIMLREIDSHEVVSFDIFDTLLMRKVLFPNDVFYLMQKREGLNDSFPENRISVEKKMMSEGIIAPSIFEIYKRLIDEYPEAGYDEQKLINLEYELDRNLILCRNDITYAFIYARMKKKRIFLISDMYYSKGQIQQILLDNDIVGYEDILISSEYGINKEEGLFVKLLEKLDSKKVLHVGDCYEADILAAEQCQIDTFWIKSAVSVMNSSRYRHLLKYTNSLEQRVMLGLFVARIFNSPFALYHTLGKGIIDNSRDITYLFAAPIITEYILWLCSQVDNKKCQVIFPSRDGFILKVLYENLKSNKKLFKKLPNSVYLVTSRAVCIGASLFDEDDINYAAVFPYEGTPEHLLIERFFLGKGEIEQFDCEKYKDLIEYVRSHKKKILKRSQEIRLNYEKYLFQVLDNRELIFSDFVSSGTCQMGLQKIIGREIKGCYFVKSSDAYPDKQKLKVASLYNEESNVAKKQYVFENILTDRSPSFLFFDGDKPIYAAEKRTIEEIDFVSSSQDEVLKYFNEYTSLVNYHYNYEKSLIADYLLEVMGRKYTMIEDRVFKNYILHDDFCNRTMSIDDCL